MKIAKNFDTYPPVYWGKKGNILHPYTEVPSEI
jgi:hypothetical protein